MNQHNYQMSLERFFTALYLVYIHETVWTNKNERYYEYVIIDKCLKYYLLLLITDGL